MTLSPQTKLGPYEILTPIGQGGMGEVYRARDTKLDRDVAIKVLPDEFANDGERLARFEREAKLLASLNHPNIAGIYGLEEGDGVKALVLELVEGPTLAERIAQGPIPVDEAIGMAGQIAHALEAGHEAGVIHRDLKPANVKVKEDGTVKVLDYGLAKALEGDPTGGAESELSQSPTLTRQGTQVGMILGTAAYMSPEQAKGKRVDKRTDVWSFGAVVYEMLTGKRAFAGDDVSDTLAAVLRAEPDFGALPADSPSTLRTLVRACLTKDSKHRLRDIGDARLALDGVFETESKPNSETRRASFGLVVAAAVVAALASGVIATTLSRPDLPRVVRFTSAVDHVNATPGEGAKITRDGTTLVYVGEGGQLFRRALDAAEPTPIAGTDHVSQVAVSPDGQWVAFEFDSAVRKLPLQGGTAVNVTPPGVRGFSWGDDGMIVYGTTNGGLWRVSDAGGEPERLTEAAPGRNHSRPSHLPGGKGILFNDWALDDSRVAVLPAGASEPRVLLEGAAPLLTPSSHLLFQRGEVLWAVAFDIDRFGILGTPVPVIEGVAHSRTGAKRYDVAGDGTLIYLTPELGSGGRRIDWIDRGGLATTLVEGVDARRARVAPDAQRVVAPFDGSLGIWTFDLERRSRAQVSADSAADVVWSPDGDRIAYGNNVTATLHIVSARADGTEGIVVESPDRGLTPESWSPDGGTLLCTYGGSDIWVLSIGGEPEPLIETAATEQDARFAPDGHHFAYVSDISGRNEVHVQTFPDLDTTWTVSAGGGMYPEWSPDGRQLFYRNDGHLMVVDVRTDPSFRPGAPRVLLDAQQLEGYTEPFDVAPDGERFLFVEDAALTRESRLVVVVNWLEELERLVPFE